MHVENWNPHTLLIGMENGAAILKTVLQFLKCLNTELPYDPEIHSYMHTEEN